MKSYELSITPNRADALSMRGVAHEVAAIYDKAVNFKEFSLIETNEAATDALSVGIETDKAPYYAARILDNVTIAPSPQWLQNLLMNEGIRPINNVVDVTNYILLYLVNQCMPLTWIPLKGLTSVYVKRVLVKN